MSLSMSPKKLSIFKPSVYTFGWSKTFHYYQLWEEEKTKNPGQVGQLNKIRNKLQNYADKWIEGLTYVVTGDVWASI